MTTQGPNVPKCFADFVQENARQHQELSERIDAWRQESSERINDWRQESSERLNDWRQELSDEMHGIENRFLERVADLAIRVARVEGELRTLKTIALVVATPLVAASVAFFINQIMDMFGL